jgi:RimJ/RimL family protein N-acetyltransferase
MLDRNSTGRGLATAACCALSPVARQDGAIDLYAIVTRGNDGSCAVLRRAGYGLIQELPKRTRWWLPLVAEALTPVME